MSSVYYDKHDVKEGRILWHRHGEGDETVIMACMGHEIHLAVTCQGLDCRLLEQTSWKVGEELGKGTWEFIGLCDCNTPEEIRFTPPAGSQAGKLLKEWSNSVRRYERCLARLKKRLALREADLETWKPALNHPDYRFAIAANNVSKDVAYYQKQVWDMEAFLAKLKEKGGDSGLTQNLDK